MSGDGMWRLDGRVVLVTGAAGGIGSCIVDLLAGSGATVCACDRDVTDLRMCQADLSRPEDAAGWVESVCAEHGHVDALVNTAGKWRSIAFLDVTPGDLESSLAANFLTAWNCCQAVMPLMLARGCGSIVNFASTAGEYGSISPGSHYSAAKGAVIAFTKSLAREVSPNGIRVNAISPGPIATKALLAGAPEASDVVARTLLGRLGTPADIAAAVLYLVSDASSFVTGQVLGVNGGSRL